MGMLRHGFAAHHHLFKSEALAECVEDTVCLRLHNLLYNYLRHEATIKNGIGTKTYEGIL
jgi:hypothetical protein